MENQLSRSPADILEDVIHNFYTDPETGTLVWMHGKTPLGDVNPILNEDLILFKSRITLTHDDAKRN